MELDKLFLSLDNFWNTSFKRLNWKGGSKNIRLGLVKEKSNWTFKNLKIPHRIVTSTGDKISNIFELFSYNILETVVLGYAQNLNPYDQPAVEQIKVNTFNS